MGQLLLIKIQTVRDKRTAYIEQAYKLRFNYGLFIVICAGLNSQCHNDIITYISLTHIVIGLPSF